jgi:hypothetical protein
LLQALRWQRLRHESAILDAQLCRFRQILPGFASAIITAAEPAAAIADARIRRRRPPPADYAVEFSPRRRRQPPPLLPPLSISSSADTQVYADSQHYAVKGRAATAEIFSSTCAS